MSIISVMKMKVKALVSELEMIEDEIFGLERKVDELRLQMYQERAQVRELDMRSQKHNKLQRSVLRDDQWRSMSQKYDSSKSERSIGSGDSRRASDARSLASSNSNPLCSYQDTTLRVLN